MRSPPSIAGPSPHFTWGEFACRDGTPVPAYAHDDVRELARRYLEPLRAHWGPVTIVSGYRTPRYNIAVGGAPASYHVYLRHRRGAAADLRCHRGTPGQWARTLDELGVPGLGRYDNHVHADTRAGRARW